MAAKLAYIFFSMILVNNYVLVKFLGICPFLGVSKKLDSAFGMSCAVIFVMTLATAVTWPVQQLLDTFGLGYLHDGTLPRVGIDDARSPNHHIDKKYRTDKVADVDQRPVFQHGCPTIFSIHQSRNQHCIVAGEEFGPGQYDQDKSQGEHAARQQALQSGIVGGPFGESVADE